MGHVTLQEFIKASSSDIPEEFLDNAKELIRRVDALRQLYDRSMFITSAYRDPDYNRRIGGALNSNHCQCLAIDIADPDRRLCRWLFSNMDTLTQLKLWIEDPSYTNSWCHFQSVPPKSGKRMFKP